MLRGDSMTASVMITLLVSLFGASDTWKPPANCVVPDRPKDCLLALESILPSEGQAADRDQLLSAAEYLLEDLLLRPGLDEALRGTARSLQRTMLSTVFAENWWARKHLMMLHEAAPDDWSRLAYAELLTHFHPEDWPAHIAAATTLSKLLDETTIDERERHHYLKAIELAEPGYRAGVAMWYHKALTSSGRNAQADDFKESFADRFDTGSATVADRLQAIEKRAGMEDEDDLRKLIVQYCTGGHLLLVGDDSACRTILQFLRSQPKLPAGLAEFARSVLPILERSGFTEAKDAELKAFFSEHENSGR